MDAVQNVTSPTLFLLSGSPFARLAEMVVLHKKLDVKRVTLEFSSGVTRSDEFKALNPRGKVPTLVDFKNEKKIVVYESLAIAQYLDLEYPDVPLLPLDSELRAQALTRTAEVTSLTSAFMFIPMQLFRESDETRSIDVMVKGMQGLFEELSVWESYLASGSTYLVGDSPVFADFGLFCILSFANRMGFEPFLASMYPKLANFVKNIDELECAKKSFPPNWASNPPSEKYAGIIAEVVEKAKSAKK